MSFSITKQVLDPARDLSREAEQLGQLLDTIARGEILVGGVGQWDGQWTGGALHSLGVDLTTPFSTLYSF